MVKVLVIKPSSLGDIIHAAEGVERIARSRADCRLTWLVNSEYVDFVREFPGVSHALGFPRSRFRAGRFPLWVPAAVRWLAGLRGEFDVVVDLQGLQRSAIMTRATGARERFGLASARELAWLHYNRRVEVPATIEHAVDRVNYAVDRVLESSAVLAVASSRIARAASRLRVPEDARRRAAELVATDPRPLLVLCPGARWPSKLWPAERWGDLLRGLQQRHAELRPVFVGAPGEQHLVDEARGCAAKSGGDAAANVESLVGKASIWDTAALMERAAAVVTMDSAPLHLAVAVGAPTVSFFGPTAPERVGPRGEQHRILRRDLDCLSCYERRCPLPQRVCLPETTADEVLDAVASVLRSVSDGTVSP